VDTLMYPIFATVISPYVSTMVYIIL